MHRDQLSGHRCASPAPQMLEQMKVFTPKLIFDAISAFDVRLQKGIPALAS